MPILQTEKAILADLIRFDTTSDRSNLSLIDYVADRLDGTGASIDIKLNDKGTKANLLATLGPKGKEGGLILSGHTDTVPVAGQDWATNPYTLVERDNKLFARGSVDMKGFDALALSRFIEVANNQDKLIRPLSVLLTYDEEIGCFGAKDFVRDHGDLLGKPELILVGEPTELKPVIAHKGIHCFDVTIAGQSCHSSNPNNGINAIEHATAAIQFLLDFSESANPDESYGAKDTRFTPPNSTINIGQIEGGSAVNIVADFCKFTFETRPIPGETRDDLLRFLKYFFDDNGLKEYHDESSRLQPGEFYINEYVSSPPYDGNLKAAGTQALIAELEHKDPLAVAFMTEASAFQNAGFNTVVCGPGSIDQAHQPNEFITLDQFKRGADLLDRVTQRCFQPR